MRGSQKCKIGFNFGVNFRLPPEPKKSFGGMNFLKQIGLKKAKKGNNNINVASSCFPGQCATTNATRFCCSPSGVPTASSQIKYR